MDDRKYIIKFAGPIRAFTYVNLFMREEGQGVRALPTRRYLFSFPLIEIEYEYLDHVTAAITDYAMKKTHSRHGPWPI